MHVYTLRDRNTYPKVSNDGENNGYVHDNTTYGGDSQLLNGSEVFEHIRKVATKFVYIQVPVNKHKPDNVNKNLDDNHRFDTHRQCLTLYERSMTTRTLVR